MRAFIIPGDVSHLAGIAGHLNEQVCGILLHQEDPVASLTLPADLLPALRERVITLATLKALNPVTPSEADRLCYREALEFVLRDPRAQYLATRSYLDSPFNNTVVIEKVLVNSLMLLRERAPTCLVCSSAPHSIAAWVFARCAEYLGLPVYILESTPIAFRSWLLKGMDTQEVATPPSPTPDGALSDVTRNIVTTQRESRPGVRDAEGYKVSRMYLSSIPGADANVWWSNRRELKSIFAGRLRSAPLRALASWKKRALWTSYRDAAVAESPDAPFVVFFLHYQPERSSLPVGLHFSQQWLAIRLLAWSLPEGWKLVVREHPTTWLRALDVTVRTKSFYRDIAALPNTVLGSMDVDTFDLIDQSRAVATLTGHVGFQALLRDRPAIVFGLAAYKDHPACYTVGDGAQLSAALRAIQDGEPAPHFSDAALENYLQWVERHSVSADPAEGEWMAARLKNFADIYRRIFAGEWRLEGTRISSD